jgi:minor extracellular serine protease Vpr
LWENDDPIDRMGHGRAVASAFATVAPDVQLIAVKSCITPSAAKCPDFALIFGIEYLLDPNEDDNIDDKVDIINLSLGAALSSAYHDFVAVSLEHAPIFGVVYTTSFDNDGNLPHLSVLQAMSR